MPEYRRETQRAYVSGLSDRLGLSEKAVRRKLRWGRVLLLVAAEPGRELDPPVAENARILQALRERIGALEQSLDKAEADRRLLIRNADAERTMLLETIIEASKSDWPGLWPWLRRLWLGEAVRSGGSARTNRAAQ